MPPDRDEGREERAGHDASQLHGKCSLRCVPSGEVEGEVPVGSVMKLPTGDGLHLGARSEGRASGAHSDGSKRRHR